MFFRSTCIVVVCCPHLLYTWPCVAFPLLQVNHLCVFCDVLSPKALYGCVVLLFQTQDGFSGWSCTVPLTHIWCTCVGHCCCPFTKWVQACHIRYIHSGVTPVDHESAQLSRLEVVGVESPKSPEAPDVNPMASQPQTLAQPTQGIVAANVPWKRSLQSTLDAFLKPNPIVTDDGSDDIVQLTGSLTQPGTASHVPKERGFGAKGRAGGKGRGWLLHTDQCIYIYSHFLFWAPLSTVQMSTDADSRRHQSAGNPVGSCGVENHLEERLLDQAQARASYTPPPFFWVIRVAYPKA